MSAQKSSWLSWDDKELLLKAAKAAGLTLYLPSDGPMLVENGVATRHWNPLKDDGDALRLAVKLGLCVDIHNYRLEPYTDVGNSTGIYIEAAHMDDAAKATRRAIVRAAAKLGKSRSEITLEDRENQDSAN